MANRRHSTTHTDETRTRGKRRPKRSGDVLGLSDADPGVEIPRATDDRGGHPRGIDVRQPATGFGDVQRSKGATGADMGAAGEDTALSADFKRPRAAEDPEE